MKTAALYRRLVLRTLHAIAGHAMTEDMIADAVKLEVPKGTYDLSAMREAMEWHLKQNHIRSRMNADIDEREWIITQAGIAKAELE